MSSAAKYLLLVVVLIEVCALDARDDIEVILLPIRNPKGAPEVCYVAIVSPLRKYIYTKFLVSSLISRLVSIEELKNSVKLAPDYARIRDFKIRLTNRESPLIVRRENFKVLRKVKKRPLLILRFTQIPLTFKVFGRMVRLNLRRNDRIVSPWLQVRKHNARGATEKLNAPNPCHYLHEDEITSAAISFCQERVLVGDMISHFLSRGRGCS